MRLATILTAGMLVLGACSGAKKAEDGALPGDDAVPTQSGGPLVDPSATPSVDGLPSPGTSVIPSSAPTTPTTTKPPTTGTKKFVSKLFTKAEETIGITDTEIRLCIHAALTYGAAFNTGEADLNVYWDAVNAKGGIFGRQVRTFWENDNYSPDTARTAANACKDQHDPFMLIGGIGFDQIPAVRRWAEDNRMLYVHHTATVEGTAGQEFSFSGKPTTERMGEMFAELAVSRFKNKRIGIIKRASDNWEPGVKAFHKLAKQHGLDIVYEKAVQVNQGNYTQEILDLQEAKGGAQVVWVWLNALETTEFVTQARNQGYAPNFMVFPFNLESQTLDSNALNPRMVGVGMYQAYSHRDYTGEFAKYADDMKQFERHYATHRPQADLDGLGGDLIFLAWSDFKAVHRLLTLCGKDCNRNRLVEVLHNLQDVATSSACKVDFSRGDPHNGGHRVSVMETYRAPDGKVNWRNTDTCVERLI